MGGVHLVAPKGTGHGGRRPGAGRKRLSDTEPTEELTITLPRSQADLLRKLGEVGARGNVLESGNASAGVRKLIAFYESQGSPPME